MAQKDLEYRIKWLTDTASLQATIQGAQKVENTIETGFQQIVSAARKGELSIKEVRQALRQVGASDNEINAIVGTLRAADQQADELAESVERVDRALDKAGSRRINLGGALDSTDTLGRVGGQIFSGLGNSEAANVAGLVGDVAGSFTTLNPILAGTVLVGGAVSLIFADIQRKLEEAKEAGQEYIDSQTQVNDLISGGATSDDIQKRIGDIEGQRAGLQESLDLLQGYQDKLIDTRDKFSGDGIGGQLIATAAIYDELEAATGGYIGSQAELSAAIEEAQQRIDATTGPLALLNIALDNNATAANDAVAAAETFKERFADGIRGLAGDVEDFFSRAADAYAAGQERLSEQTDAYVDALKEEGEIRDKIAKITRQIADIQLETATKVLAIETERDERLAQLASEYGDKIGELTADGEEKRQQIIADSNDRIAKIQAASGVKLRNLVAQRDALAHFLEAQQATQQIQDEKDNAAKSLIEQEKAQTKQLDSQKKAYDKSLQAQNAAADKSIRAQYDASNRQLQTLFQQYNAEQVALDNLQVSLQNIALYGSNGQRVIHTQMWNDLASVAVVGAQNLVGAITGIFAGGGSSQFPTLTSTYGAAIPSTQQSFDRQFDRRMAETLGIGYGQIRGY